MKYFILIALMGLGSSVASAAVSQTGSITDDRDHDRDRRERVDVRFDCHFRSVLKAGVACEARGEVCLDRDGRFGIREEDGRCEHNRNRLRHSLSISCNDGYHDEDRAFGFLRRSEGERRRERDELIIQAERFGRDGGGGFEDRIRIFDVRLDRERDHDRDDRRDRDDDRFSDDFDAVLTRDGWVGGPLAGRCFVNFERHREERREAPRPAPAEPTRP